MREIGRNQAMIANTSGRVIVVADHHKLGHVSSVLTGPLDRADLLMTDWRANAMACDELRAAGMTVERVADEAHSSPTTRPDGALSSTACR